MSLNKRMLICCLLALLACERHKGPAERPPVPVKVAQAASKTMPFVIRGVGNLVAWNRVEVTPQVSGEITAVYFENGDFVKGGDLLFTIDPSPFEAELDQALGELKQAEALLAFNEQRVERYQGLLPEDFVSQLTFADFVSQTQVSEGQILQFRGAVEAAEVNLEYCWIRAGLSGKTSRRLVDPGNVVFPDEAQVLVTINQVQPIYILWSVPERYLPELLKRQAEQPLEIRCEVLGEEGKEHTGILSFIGNQVDTYTGTIQLEGNLQNEDLALWPGQYAKVTTVLYEIPDTVVIPSAAVGVNTKGKFVFVVKEDQTVEMRQITAGQQFGEEIVIEKGVAAGECVVTEGQVALGSGSKVRIKNDGGSRA